jgi:hypothetical protein
MEPCKQATFGPWASLFKMPLIPIATHLAPVAAVYDRRNPCIPPPVALYERRNRRGTALTERRYRVKVAKTTGFWSNADFRAEIAA